MTEIKNLTKRFGKKTVLNDVSIQLDTGVYGLLGPNGSGKTTLIRCIAGLYRYQGQVNAPKQIGYLPQKFGAFPELRVGEVMAYFANLKKLPKKQQKQLIDEALEAVHLTERKRSLIRSLSGGMVRRVGVAQALLGDPELVMVDEPTAGLDPEERLRFKNLIAERRKNETILISTHIVEDVETLCDHIIILHEGKVLRQDTPENIRLAATGHVYRVPEYRQSQLTGDYYLLRKESVEGETCLRILSDTQQLGEPVAPTLEDGYIYLIRGGK